MKIKHLLVPTAASLTLLATSAIAVAQQARSAWIEQKVINRIVARVEGKLALTPDQREQARAILSTEEPAILSLAEQAKQERAQLMALNHFDDGQVHQIAQQYATTNTEILVERAKIRLELRAILNDGQRRQLDEMRDRVGTHLGDRIDTWINAI